MTLTGASCDYQVAVAAAVVVVAEGEDVASTYCFGQVMDDIFDLVCLGTWAFYVEALPAHCILGTVRVPEK